MQTVELFKPELPTAAGDLRRWSGLHGSSLSLAVANIAQNHQGPVILITANTEEADVMRRELGFFCAATEAASLHTLPDWETLPYDNFSPHQDIISDPHSDPAPATRATARRADSAGQYIDAPPASGQFHYSQRTVP